MGVLLGQQSKDNIRDRIETWSYIIWICTVTAHEMVSKSKRSWVDSICRRASEIRSNSILFSPGSRSIYCWQLWHEHSIINCVSTYDETGAALRALGYTRATKRPAAMATSRISIKQLWKLVWMEILYYYYKQTDLTKTETLGKLSSRSNQSEWMIGHDY